MGYIFNSLEQTKVRIGYVSDLHLEFRDYPMFWMKENADIGGDVLILAGDITTARTVAPHRTDRDSRSWQKYAEYFGEEVISKYKHVFYVMGNHEHYNSIFSNTASTLLEGFKKVGFGWEKVELFDNNFLVIEDTLFIGATLWSDFEKGSPISMWECGRSMNDYHVIYNDGGNNPITPEFTLDEHYKSVAYIRVILNLNQAKKTVVFTHHAPTLTSLNKQHVGNGLDGAYASDLSDLICGYPQIRYWVHGHTHMNVDYSVGDHCKVIANQRGYRGERSYAIWSGIKHIEI